MTILSGITEQPKQTTTIVLPDGSKATLRLEYRPQQTGWFFDLEWSDFTANGLRLVASPNILRTFRKLIPFGMAVLTDDAVEPLNQNDFADGVVTLILLDRVDVESVEETIYVGQ